MDDSARNPDLEDLVSIITGAIFREIKLRWKGSVPPNFLLIMLADDMMEFSCATDDHEMMFDAMSEIGANWVEQGLVAITPEATPTPRVQ
jgi:hypothetical protein